MVCHRGVCHVSTHLNGRESNQQGSTLESVGTRRNINLIHFNLIESVYKGDGGSPGKLQGLAFRVIKNRKSINWDHSFSIPITFLEQFRLLDISINNNFPVNTLL